MISKEGWSEHPIVLGTWFLKPAIFNQSHIGKAHRERSVGLFVPQNEREKEKEGNSSGEEYLSKEIIQGHPIRLYFDISEWYTRVIHCEMIENGG